MVQRVVGLALPVSQAGSPAKTGALPRVITVATELALPVVPHSTAATSTGGGPRVGSVPAVVRWWSRRGTAGAGGGASRPGGTAGHRCAHCPAAEPVTSLAAPKSAIAGLLPVQDSEPRTLLPARTGP